jgi:hypothetical protein
MQASTVRHDMSMIHVVNTRPLREHTKQSRNNTKQAPTPSTGDPTKKRSKSHPRRRYCSRPLSRSQTPRNQPAPNPHKRAGV